MADGADDGATMADTLRARRSRRRADEQARQEALYNERQTRVEAQQRLQQLQAEVARLAAKQAKDQADLLAARQLSAKTPAQVDAATPWQFSRMDDMHRDGQKKLGRDQAETSRRARAAAAKRLEAVPEVATAAPTAAFKTLENRRKFRAARLRRQVWRSDPNYFRDSDSGHLPRLPPLTGVPCLRLGQREQFGEGMPTDARVLRHRQMVGRAGKGIDDGDPGGLSVDALSICCRLPLLR